MRETTAEPSAPVQQATGWPPRLRAPAVWQALQYLRDPDGFFSAAHNRYGDAFTIHMLGERWIVLAHPDAVRDVFAQGPSEVNSGEPNQVLRPMIGRRNLLLMDGREHLHRRRMVLPSFHGERMRGYEPVIRGAAAREVASWPIGVPLAVLPRMEALVFGVVLRCVFGLSEAERLGPLAGRLRRMLGWITDRRRLLVFFLLGPAQLMRLPAFARQMRMLDREVFSVIATRRTAGDLPERQDILSVLIQARDEGEAGLSDEELRDELVTLLVAGHQNTAALLAWAVHELVRSEGSQERLVAEPRHFADAVITETLRLRPPVPLVVRRLRTTLTIEGHELPAGTNVGPSTLLVHRRADLYPQPLSFQPQRFLDRRPMASEWFPFGGSVRRCVGAALAQLEARIVLEEITRALRLSPERDAPEKTRPRAIVLVPARGARVIAARR